MSKPSLPAWRRYLHFWRADVGADVDAELRFHFDARVADLVSGGGLTPEAARAQAVAEFGDVDSVSRGLREIDTRVVARRARADRLSGWWQDFAYAARSIRRAPGLTVAVVLTLALGLGANAALFSLLDVLFLRAPDGVAAPDQVRRLWVQHYNVRTGEPGYQGRTLYFAEYQAIARSLGSDAEVALYRDEADHHMGPGHAGAPVTLTYATASLFHTLRVAPQLGRFFTPDEDRLGAGSPVAVVSDAFWRRQLHADPRVLGTTLDVDNQKFVIIGVTPPGFTGVELQPGDAWVPFGVFSYNTGKGPPWWENPNVNGMFAVARLAPGVSDAVVGQRATLAMRALARGTNTGYADTLQAVTTGSIIGVRGPGEQQQEVSIAIRLGGVAVIVLLIAIANVVNLLLARAVRRRREIAVRLALGISRGRLVRLLTAESVLLALLSGVAALLAAWWGGALLRSLLLPDIRWAAGAMQWSVVAFTACVSLAAGAAAGLVPALSASNPELTGALKSGVREGGGQRSGLRNTLVAAQAALSMVLLVGAVLFVTSLRNVRGLDLGFDTDRLVSASVSFEPGQSPPRAVVAARVRDVATQLRAMPGVEDVALTSMAPMYGFSWEDFFTATDSSESFSQELLTFTAVSPSYFRTAGLRLLRGSDFPQTSGASMPAVVVVNDAMAKLVWHGAEAIGQCMYFTTRASPCYRVIGVVETARRGYVIEEPAPQYYLPADHKPDDVSDATSLLIRRSPGNAAAVTAVVRSALTGAFPGGNVNLRAMSDYLGRQYRPWRLGATLFTIFGLLALLVASVGIYSTVSYGVTQRTHEFGVRLALGAGIATVMRQVVREGVRVVIIGVVAGVVLALLGARLVKSLLYGISATNPWAMTGVAMVLVAVAALAALAPAWRAARVDPVRALREE
jgi:predicted permease